MNAKRCILFEQNVAFWDRLYNNMVSVERNGSGLELRTLDYENQGSNTIDSGGAAFAH